MKRKTKIVCTIGPATDSEEMLEKIIAAGMDVARLNFSHSSLEEQGARIRKIRQVSEKMNRHIGIMADTKGPEIRTGIFEDGMAHFKKGDVVWVLKEEVVGNRESFSLSSPEIFSDIEPGAYLLIDDGKIRLDVLKTTGKG